MIDVETAEALIPYVGRSLGVSAWLTIDQPLIDAFAEATGDRQWIHVDVARAAREAAGGKTIAHGYLTLSLLPRLSAGIYTIRACSRSVNYGLDRLRFISPVPSGSRIRLAADLRSVEPASGGHRITIAATVEIEGAAKPALVVDTIRLVFA